MYVLPVVMMTSWFGNAEHHVIFSGSPVGGQHRHKALIGQHQPHILEEMEDVGSPAACNFSEAWSNLKFSWKKHLSSLLKIWTLKLDSSEAQATRPFASQIFDKKRLVANLHRAERPRPTRESPEMDRGVFRRFYDVLTATVIYFWIFLDKKYTNY